MGVKPSNLEQGLLRLRRVVTTGRGLVTCLRVWSEFIRLRDGNRCVACHETKHLSAHHVCRKSFFREARFLTGNGITLCRVCHKEVHAGFNGKPDMSLPMDEQGGERIEVMTSLFGLLLEDAKERDIYFDDYYHLTESVLAKFKMLQGFDPFTYFPGRELEQTVLIWRQCPLQLKNAILTANGIPPSSEPVLPGVTVRLMQEEQSFYKN